MQASPILPGPIRQWAVAEPLRTAATASPFWLVGIFEGRIQDGRPFQCLAVLEARSGEPLALQVASQWTPSRVAAALDNLVEGREPPQRLSGITEHQELPSLLQRWCDARGGTPTWLASPAAIALLAEGSLTASGAEPLERLLDRLEQRCQEAASCRSLRQLQRAMDDWMVDDDMARSATTAGAARRPAA